ncbi:MAG: DUF6768 family protein [Fidelibacterota bacterium]
MNTKRFVGASLAVFVTNQVTDLIIHGGILSSTYDSLKNIWRAEMESTMWIMYVTSFVFAFLFIYIFSKGYEGKGISEGIKYGIIIGLLMNVVGMFNQYAVYPIPFILTIQWFIYGMIQYTIYGILAALIYRPNTTA